MEKETPSALLVMVGLVVFTTPCFSQYGPESFEGYPVDSFVVGQGDWRTWNDVPGGPGNDVDARISDASSHSGTRSLRLQTQTNIVQAFRGAFTSGTWTVSAWVNIPSSTTGGTVNLVLLNHYNSGSSGIKNWSTQIRFNPATHAVDSLGGSGFVMPGQLPYQPNVWNQVQIVVDLDNLTQEIYLNNSYLASGPWHDDGFTTQDAIECINIVSLGANDGFVDDVSITEGFACGSCCPIRAVACEQTPSATQIVLSWDSQGADYPGGIRIARNGLSIATLPGTAESYLDPNAVSGVNSYTITGLCPGAFNATATCRVCVADIPAGTTDYVWSAGLGRSPASAQAIADELSDWGREPLVCNSLNLPAPNDSGDLTGLWICLGVFPNNYQLSVEEGQSIVDWVTAARGRFFYIEGGDVWGFDPPTPLDAIDGTSASSDGSSFCNVDGLTGLNSQVPGGLDLTGIDGSYVSDCRWIDHLVADDVGASGPVFRSTIGSNHFTGIYHDANVRYTGTHRNLCASTLFGGFLGSREALMDAYATSLTSPPPTPFLRGDADGNGTFHALVDGLEILTFGFVPGTPELPCLAAADADGSGLFNALIDAARILSFGFIPGSPPLPPPFPLCGEDRTTIDALGCQQPTCD